MVVANSLIDRTYTNKRGQILAVSAPPPELSLMQMTASGGGDKISQSLQSARWQATDLPEQGRIKSRAGDQFDEVPCPQILLHHHARIETPADAHTTADDKGTR